MSSKEDLNTIKLSDLIREMISKKTPKFAVITGIIFILISIIFKITSYVKATETIDILGVPFNLKGGVMAGLFFGIGYCVLGGIIWALRRR